MTEITKPKGQQSGQIVFQKPSILSQPSGKNAKVIPALNYNPKPKPSSKRDIHRQQVANKKLK